MSEPVIASVFWLIIIGGCVERINDICLRDGDASMCEGFGYLGLVVGAVACLVEWWLPEVNVGVRGETIAAAGMALIALSTLRPRLRGLWARITGKWDGVERRGDLPPGGLAAAKFVRRRRARPVPHDGFPGV